MKTKKNYSIIYFFLLQIRRNKGNLPAAELDIQWTTKREVELEDRTLTESNEKLERNLNVSIERDEETEDFLSADWAIAEKDTEVTAAIAKGEEEENPNSALLYRK